VTSNSLLPMLSVAEFRTWCGSSNARVSVATQVTEILDSVRTGGVAALLREGERCGDLSKGEPWLWSRDDLNEVGESLPAADLSVIDRVANRIAAFARAQRASIADFEHPIPGGRAGCRTRAVASVGCYVPGGLYPLFSSLLMTVIPARVAGVERVIVASPRPSRELLALAARFEVDTVLGIGGAQAIAALSYGVGVDAVDLIVGPGGKWVDQAKRQLAGSVRIDMPAGPSELLVMADASSDPEVIATDLLAQAEHDTAARVVLIGLDEGIVERVRAACTRQLESLPSRRVAEVALANSAAVVTRDLDEAAQLANMMASEHVSLQLRGARNFAGRLQNFGGLFVGPVAAEAFGDYGAGPNHVLPTAGAARSWSGLSVETFLRRQTWMEMDDDAHTDKEFAALVRDTARLARLEGLEAHARSAEARLARSGGRVP